MGLRENMCSDPVSTLALREPATAKLEATIREAIVQMRAQKLGCVIVVDAHEKPLGMFTESMLTQLLAQDHRVVEDRLADHMAKQWPHVTLTDTIESVLDALDFKNVRFLCVVDDADRLVGLAGQKGLMEYVADHFPLRVMVQRIEEPVSFHEREGA
ncbi:MAG: cyclic nucleotide-binding/CBS domain-containing protein [Pirellulales bacterium]